MLIDDDLGDIFTEQPQIPPVDIPQIEEKFDLFEGTTSNTTQNDLILEMLKVKGINDPKQITILGENDEEQIVDFDTLTKEEQLQILNSYDEVTSNNLPEKSEVEKYLEENNMTFDEFLNAYKEQILSENGSPLQNYSVDSYTDEELFMLDFKSKYDDLGLSDDELQKELDKELANTELFKKKIDKIRSDYKTSEDAYKEQQQVEYDKENQQRYEDFSESMLNVAMETPELYNIELEDEEKNATLSYLLDLDENGVSDFSKALNDPKKLYEAAWFLKYGKDVFDTIKTHYESEITKLKKQINKPGVIIKDTPKKEVFF